MQGAGRGSREQRAVVMQLRREKLLEVMQSSCAECSVRSFASLDAVLVLSAGKLYQKLRSSLVCEAGFSL